MQRIYCFVLLLFFAAAVASQEFNSDAMLKRFQSERWFLYQEAQERPTYRALWEGKGTWLGARIFLRSGGEEELGLSEEQGAKLAFLHKENEIGQEIMQRKFQEQDPVLMQLMQESQTAAPKDDPDLAKATPEQKKSFVEANERFFRFFTDMLDQEVESTLTPEQLAKVRTLNLQLLPEMGLPVPSMFEPLGLSEEQQQQMAAIKEELKPEFEKLLDEVMELRKESLRSMVDTLTQEMKENKPESYEAFSKAMRVSSEQSKKNNEALQKKYRENAERGRQFATRLKSRLMNVLTDAQLDKMQELIDNMPQFAKKLRSDMKANREALEKSGQWQPGPDSWRPGDGSPAEFKKERSQKAFPR